MPSGDFTNPRYQEENKYLSNSELKDKYGYVPRINSEDYSCKQDYEDELNDAKRHGYDERDLY